MHNATLRGLAAIQKFAKKIDDAGLPCYRAHFWVDSERSKKRRAYDFGAVVQHFQGNFCSTFSWHIFVQFGDFVATKES
jgi:hypothetical protein